MDGVLQGHPERERWLPLLVLPPILMLDGALDGEAMGLTVLGALAAYAGCLPLLVRRTASVPVFSLLLTAGIVLVLWRLHPGTTVVLIPAWALFDVGRVRTPRQARIALVATPFFVLISVAPFNDGAGEIITGTLRNAAICELALVLGLLLRRTREAHEEALRAAESQTARAAGEERLRIAQEVHDVVAHAMVAISVQSGVAIHRLDRDPDQVRDALHHIRRTSTDALEDLRSTLGVLRDPGSPAPVAPSGIDGLESLAGRLRAAGVEVALDVAPLPDVPADVGAAGYRVVQESLTNVLRHARATSADVRVRTTDGRLLIDVRDDGVGGAAAGSGAPESRAAPDRDPDPDPGSGTGSGVQGMRRRVEALGGRLESGPADAAAPGWHVHASLPLSAP